MQASVLVERHVAWCCRLPRERRALDPQRSSSGEFWLGAFDDDRERFGACWWFRPRRVWSDPEPRTIASIIAMDARSERCLCCWAMPIDMKQPNRTQAWFWRLAPATSGCLMLPILGSAHRRRDAGEPAILDCCDRRRVSDVIGVHDLCWVAGSVVYWCRLIARV